MKRTSNNSFNLFGDKEDDLCLPLPIMNNKENRELSSVSLTLFDDLLLDHHRQVLAPLPLNVVAPPQHPVFLFGVCISTSPDNSSALAIVPYSGRGGQSQLEDVPRKRKYVRKAKAGVVPRRQRVHNQPEPCPEPLPPMILENIQRDGGNPPVFLFQKRLTHSDVQKHENRLFLSRPMDQLMMKFLNQLETSQANGEGDGLRVPATDPKGDNYELQLKKWPSMQIYVLKKEWSKLVHANQLIEGDWIQLWGYRINSQLHLAANINKAENNGSVRGSSSGSSSGSGDSITTKT